MLPSAVDGLCLRSVVTITVPRSAVTVSAPREKVSSSRRTAKRGRHRRAVQRGCAEGLHRKTLRTPPESTSTAGHRRKAPKNTGKEYRQRISPQNFSKGDSSKNERQRKTNSQIERRISNYWTDFTFSACRYGSDGLDRLAARGGEKAMECGELLMCEA